MGGNALSFETRRVSAGEYFEICKEIQDKAMDSTKGSIAMAVIPAYDNKPDFGDIDILVSDHYMDEEIDRVEWIQETFEPREIFSNGNVHSFDYKGVQIDFIYPLRGEFTTSLWYFSYNDLGNLLGRIYHKMGLRFGHDGLSLLVREDDHIIGEVHLSDNIDEILEFGGYSSSRYHDGFKDLTDIFEYVVTSPFYTYEIFDLDNRNHKSRIRDRKRKTYTEFLTWALEHPKKWPYKWAQDKKAYLPFIFAKFGGEEKYLEILANNEIRKQVKEKFNGEIIMKLTGLYGKELGAFMAAFKDVFSQEDLLNMTPMQIEQEVTMMFERKFQ